MIKSIPITAARGQGRNGPRRKANHRVGNGLLAIRMRNLPAQGYSIEQIAQNATMRRSGTAPFLGEFLDTTYRWPPLATAARG